jgi:hypothetical protein
MGRAIEIGLLSKSRKDRAMLVSVSRQELLSHIRHHGFSFIGVVSFEERSTAWAKYLNENQALPTQSYLFDYATTAEPEEVDISRRSECRDSFAKNLSTSDFTLEFIETPNAFAMNRIQADIRRVFDESAGKPLLVDISCMTRVHLLAMVTAVRKLHSRPSEVYFCYSIPETYGPKTSNRFGWKDVLFLPIGVRRLFHREGLGRGIILAGYDGERLSIALTEIEPASGCLVYSRSPRRPDFVKRAREANKVVERRLSNLRMPRTSTVPSESDKWTTEVVDSYDFGKLLEAVKPQVSQAKKEESPVILFPFGPKPVTLALALAFHDWGVDEAWAVYPIPEKFSVSYSSGVDDILVFRNVETFPV